MCRYEEKCDTIPVDFLAFYISDYYLMPALSRKIVRSFPNMRIIVHKSGELGIPVTAIRSISATSETFPL